MLLKMLSTVETQKLPEDHCKEIEIVGKRVRRLLRSGRLSHKAEDAVFPFRVRPFERLLHHSNENTILRLDFRKFFETRCWPPAFSPKKSLESAK